MFCPRCSLQQASEEARFCPRCGLRLGVVKAVLSADDELDGSSPGPTPDRSLRKRDLTVGALFMFIAALVAAALTVDMPPSHSARIILLFIAWALLSLLLNIGPILRYFLHGDSSPAASKTPRAKHVGPATNATALPPAQSVPVNNFNGQRADTAEVFAPRASPTTQRTFSSINNKAEPQPLP